MKKSITILLILLKNTNLFSQEENIPMSIGLGGGIDIISSKDISVSPLTYNGFGLPFGINGFKISNQWMHNFEVQITLPSITNNYTLRTKVASELINWTKINFRYQLLRQIGRNRNNFLGGEIKSNLFYREYDFLDGYGYSFQNSIQINYARKLNLNKNSFIITQMSMPILGYINRKSSLTYDENFLNDFNNKGLTSLLKYGKLKAPFDNWISFDVDFLYHLNLSYRFKFQARIGVNYYSIQFPEKVQNINIPIRCYINYQF